MQFIKDFMQLVADCVTSLNILQSVQTFLKTISSEIFKLFVQYNISRRQMYTLDGINAVSEVFA